MIEIRIIYINFILKQYLKLNVISSNKPPSLQIAEKLIILEMRLR